MPTAASYTTTFLNVTADWGWITPWPTLTP